MYTTADLNQQCIKMEQPEELEEEEKAQIIIRLVQMRLQVLVLEVAVVVMEAQDPAQRRVVQVVLATSLLHGSFMIF